MHENRDHLRLERDAGQVEDELLGVLTANQAERDCRAEHPRQHQLIRRKREEPDHERDLAQRVRLRLLPEVDEDPSPLGRRERDDERREDDDRRHRELPGLHQWGDGEDIDGTRGRDKEGVERPDRREAAALAFLWLRHRSGPRIVDV